MSRRGQRRASWRTWALAVLIAVIGLLVIVVAVRPGSSAPPRAGTGAVDAPPSPVITPTGPSRPTGSGPVSRSQLAAARTVARRFLAGYLPYLYGRAPARRVTHVTVSVARSLRRSPVHVTPAQRRRHPRLVGLTLIGQTPDSVIATARIADGGVSAYPLSFTLQRTARTGWVVADLGND